MSFVMGDDAEGIFLGLHNVGPSPQTTKPSNPTDGERWIYDATALNAFGLPVFWEFQWVASRSLWAFVGGGSIQKEDSSTLFTMSANNTWTEVLTGINVPFAGTYTTVTEVSTRDSAAGNVQHYSGLTYNGGQLGLYGGYLNAIQSGDGCITVCNIVTVTTPGDRLGVGGYTNGIGVAGNVVQFYNRLISILPQYVL